MITQLEIAIQSIYDTNTGSGPIASALNWECATRLKKIGAFSFEMALADSKRSLLVAKRYVRCYGIVNDTWTELGKPGIIERIAKSIDGEGVPTGMIRVEGTDLLGELADILIHELDIIDTSARIPDSVQYYDGTAEAYLDMTNAYDDNPATSVEIPADDEDWLYLGDDDVFDIGTFDLGANLNTDSGNFMAQYSQGGASWGSVAILSDSTQVDVSASEQHCSFGQDGAIRIERPGDWATDTINEVAGKYWLRLRYSEDMSGDVTINEITLTQEIPTATALADWRDYTDVDGNNPLTDLGWSLDADFYTATQSTVFLKLREVSAFKALAMIAEQTGENFRLGDGREIQWLQDDKTASGIVATNAIDATAGASATTNCWITSFRQSSDAYELVGRIYPKGGGRGATRIDLAECTRTAADGYTLSTSLNYLQKDSVETDYERPIERPKYWPELMSPNAANAKDVNVANALYDLTYQYLQRHYLPQTAYDIEVVKLDSAVPVGTTLQVAYWQTVDGSAIMNVGVDPAATVVADRKPLHLWVLESTQRIDNNGLRSVAMKIATTDAWPTSGGAKMQEVVHQVLAIQATDGPMSAASLTVGSAADLLANLDLSAYAKLPSDETITGTWTFSSNITMGDGVAIGQAAGPLITFDDTNNYLEIMGCNVGIGTATPNVTASYTYTAGRHLNVYHGAAQGRISIQGHSNGIFTDWEGAALNLVDLAAVEDKKWIQLGTKDGLMRWCSWEDDGAGQVLANILTMDHTTGNITMVADLTLGNDLILANGAVVGIAGNEIITFQAAGTIDFTGADVTMDNDLTVTNDIILLDGAVVGIAGNEIITFNAAGTIAMTGADVLLGSQDGLGKLNFDEGTTIANGIVWGSDANKVTLYRSADDMLKTDDSLTVAVGVNVGTGTPEVGYGLTIQQAGGGLDYIYGRQDDGATLAFYIRAEADDDIILLLADKAGDTKVYLHTAGTSVFSGGAVLITDTLGIGVGVSTPASGVHLAGAEGFAQYVTLERVDPTVDAGNDIGALNWRGGEDTIQTVAQLLVEADQAWTATASGTRMVFSVTAQDTLVLTEALRIDDGLVATFAACLADGTCEIFTEDALGIIKDIHAHGTGQCDEYGHEHFDMPWMFSKYPYLIHKNEVGYYDKLGAKSDLLYRAAIQLDEYRLVANGEREAIRARLDSIEMGG